jgi:hypothetical protein
VITANLLTPKVSFWECHSVLCKAGFPQNPSRFKRDHFFAQSSPKINFAPLYLATSSTLPDGAEGALLWELVRLFDDFSGRKSEAVLRYLARVEANEANPHLQDDIRIAWMTVLHAASGVCDAWGYSFWSFFGKTYPKALLAWAERDEVNRKALERCAQMVRAEKEQHGNASQTTQRTNEDACGLLQIGQGGSIPGQSLPGVQEYETGAIRGVDGSRQSASENPVFLIASAPTATSSSPTNLYDSARSILEASPKKPAQSVKPDQKQEGVA